MKKVFKYLCISSFALGSLVSCGEDSLDPTLATSNAVETSINTDEDLRAVLLGMYNRMTSSAYYGRDMIIYGECRSDNAYANGSSGRFVTVSDMNMTENSGNAASAWEQLYDVIASANIIIGAEVTGDEGLIDHYKGQAYAARALAHFDLVRLYGQQHVQGGGTSALGVPYILEFKGANLSPARNTVGEVKAFIDQDMQTALSLMDAAYDDSSAQYITSNGVNALWSRFAVYFGDWGQAVASAEAVINSGEYQIIPASAYVDSWSTDSTPNSIFELAFSNIDNAGINGLANIYRGDTYGDIQAYDAVVDVFEPGDIRVDPAMIDVDGNGALRNLGKYPTMATWDDNVNIIRYEEVILNYAEALLETGGDALTWLNQIPAQRNAPAYTAATKENILLERRRELMFEGFRFDDLARTGQDAFTQPNVPGVSYGDTNFAFPIPVAELNANANMVQNAGY